MTGEELVAAATSGLVIVTFLLVVVTFVGIRRGEKHAERQLGILADQTTGLAKQTEALVEEARASQAIAAEMLEARRAANPLELDVELTDDAVGGRFVARLFQSGTSGTIVLRAEYFAGRDRLTASEPVAYSNFYIGGSTREIYLSEQIDSSGRDLLIVRVTGIPDNGLEQAIEFTYRILPGGRGFERLSMPSIVMGCRVEGDELVVAFTNTRRWPITVVGAGIADRQSAGGFVDCTGVNGRIAAGAIVRDPALPVMLDPGAPPAEVRTALSKVKGALHPAQATWVWSTDGHQATRWHRLEPEVAAAIAAVRRRVSVRDGAGGFSTVAIDDDEDLAGRPPV